MRFLGAAIIAGLAISVAGSQLGFAQQAGESLQRPPAISNQQGLSPEEAQRTPARQPHAPARGTGLRGQSGSSTGDNSLEIAPQLSNIPSSGKSSESSDNLKFRQSEAKADAQPNFAPQSESGSAQRELPYLGITVEYTQWCFKGQEEHGLEIMSIDPNSPAARAGLRAQGGMTPLGAAGVTAGAFLGPLEMAVIPLLRRAGSLGHEGDLIVAIDDYRVRTEKDLERQLAKVKPGDTVYLTVIRPMPNNQHKTMKIAVKVGEPALRRKWARTDSLAEPTLPAY